MQCDENPGENEDGNKPAKEPVMRLISHARARNRMQMTSVGIEIVKQEIHNAFVN